MSRPKTKNRTTPTGQTNISFFVNKSLLVQIQNIAKDNKMSISAYLRSLIKKDIDSKITELESSFIYLFDDQQTNNYQQVKQILDPTRKDQK